MDMMSEFCDRENSVIFSEITGSYSDQLNSICFSGKDRDASTGCIHYRRKKTEKSLKSQRNLGKYVNIRTTVNLC